MSDGKKVGCFLFLAGGALLTPFVVQCIACFFLSLSFDRGCYDWLKMAADANSVALAKERLDVAVKYIEEKHMTTGNTACFFPVPTTDLAPWYKNLKAAQENLEKFPSNPTEADTSTALVKLRETLLDHGEHGDHVTVPDGAYVFPHQIAWYTGWWVTSILGVGGVAFLCGAFVAFNDK